MKKRTRLFSWLLFGMLILPVSAQNSSQYSDLDTKKCVNIEMDEESGSGAWRCNGVAGYKLILAAGDLRETVTIVAPNRREYELNLWYVVSSGFSSVGQRAEWRMKRANGRPTPIALIVRFTASEDPDDSSKTTSYLTVSKITANSACVVAKVPPGANQNVRAQQIADRSATMPCLE